MQSLTPRGKLINAMFYMSQHLAHCSYTNTVRLLKQQCGTFTLIYMIFQYPEVKSIAFIRTVNKFESLE